MNSPKNVGLILVVMVLAVWVSAEAGSLSVVNVQAPLVNCVFHEACKVPVTDSVGNIPLPSLSGQARLQSRTIIGAAGTPGAGKTIYLYRVDLSNAWGSVECVAGMVVNFGPVTKLSYKLGSLADVFVITSGGLGTVGIKSAVQDDDVITFEFAKLLCVGQNPGNGVSTFFFGLASTTAPKTTTAEVFSIGSTPLVEVPARVPIH